jgi:hypothetical protein
MISGMVSSEPPRSIPDVCELERIHPTADRGGAAPRLLIELPHGATRELDFERLRNRLHSDLPTDLREFFFVNTDVGCYETARVVAERVARHRRCKVWILRSLLPRTLVDCNRLVGANPRTTTMTPAIPEYVEHPADRRLLEQLHASYQEQAAAAYESVHRTGGLALQLHTYAPRSIRIDRIDGSIVKALRRAYEPAVYQQWERRPVVEIISEDVDGVSLASAAWVESVKGAYRTVGVEVAENRTYRLHGDTTGYVYAARFPGMVGCLEINREQLADPFVPFAEMRIAPEKAERMAGPIATTYNQLLERGGISCGSE